MTRVLRLVGVVVAILALALLVSACGGQGGGTPTGPSTTTAPVGGGIAWSTVTGLEITPSAVPVNTNVRLELVTKDQQAGVTIEATFRVTWPNGQVDTEVSSGTTTRPGEAGMYMGYTVQMAGPYSVAVSVRQSANGQSGPEATASGAFTGVQ